MRANIGNSNQKILSVERLVVNLVVVRLVVGTPSPTDRENGILVFSFNLIIIFISKHIRIRITTNINYYLLYLDFYIFNAQSWDWPNIIN